MSRHIPRLALAALAVGSLLCTTGSSTADAKARRWGAGPGAIVFISDRDSPPGAVQDDVYLYGAATHRTSRLTADASAEAFPTLSPDGRRVAYVDDQGIVVCTLHYVAGAWSCGQTPIAVAYPHPGGGAVSWTPDGRSIVYGGNDPDDPTDIDIFKVSLFHPFAPAINLTQEAPGEPAAFDGQPTVSPDGRFFVYSHTTTGGGDLFRRRIDGSHPVRLTSTAGSTEFGAEYSPDDSRIAFHSNRKSPGDFDIYVMAPRPESSRNLAVDLTAGVTAPDGSPSRERFPTWSPDGSRLAFWWHVTAQGFDDGEIYSIAADGSDVRNLTANNPSGPTARPVGDITPDWGSVRRHCHATAPKSSIP